MESETQTEPKQWPYDYDPYGFIRRYISGIGRLVNKLDSVAIADAVHALYVAWEADSVVLFCANGGSGASCSHIVNDLQKNIAIDHGKPLMALCLNDSMPIVSAWANDESWQMVFAPQVATWGRSGGVLVGVSGSGRSTNVLNALAEANALGMFTIGITGFDGGPISTIADVSIHVPIDNMQQVEDVHMIVLHLLFLLLQERIKSRIGGGDGC